MFSVLKRLISASKKRPYRKPEQKRTHLSVEILEDRSVPTVLAWNPPANITYGTPLTSTQLDATANVPGTFAYTLANGTTPASGAVLNAGSGQTLDVTFTPTDTVDYATATDSVSINVSPASTTTSLTSSSDLTTLSLDGSSQYVAVPANSALKPTAALTVSTWVNVTAISQNTPLIGLDYNAAGSWGYPYVPYALQIWDYGTPIPAASLTVNGTLYQINTTSPLSTGAWHLLTYDGADLTLYVDGVQVAQEAVSGSISYGTSQDLFLGYYTNTSPVPNALDGSLSDARIYSRALSSAEVSSFRAATEPEFALAA